MSVRQIGHNKYLIDFYEGGRGSARHQIVYEGTLRGAHEEEEWWLRKFGKKRKRQSFTFSDLCVEYREWAKRQKGYRAKNIIIGQLEQRFGPSGVIAINRMAVERYQSDRMVHNADATVNRHIATLKHMMTKAYQWGYIKKEQNDAIHEIEMLKENNRRLRYLDRDEAELLLLQCSAHLKPIVTVAINTGMRRGEILNLKWEQIDLKNGLILLSQSDTKNAERREIPLNASAKAAITSQVRRVDIPYVFYNAKTGTRITEIKTAFNGACRRAKIKDFHFHDLRHTFASWLVMAGIPLLTVSKLLGHATINMTLRYAHLAPNHLSEAVKILENKPVVSSSEQV